MQRTTNDQLLKDIVSLGFLKVTPHLSLTEAVTELSINTNCSKRTRIIPSSKPTIT